MPPRRYDGPIVREPSTSSKVVMPRRIRIKAARRPFSPEKFRHLTMTGSVTFRASRTTGEPGKIVLRANTGRPMHLEGVPYPVVVDMEGHRFEHTSTPLLGDHDLSKRIGHSVEQLTLSAGQTGTLNGKPVRGPLIAAVGTRSSQTKYAKEVETDLRAGFPFQVSIGTDTEEHHFVEEGDSEVVNGRRVHGPIIIADQTVTREVTITTVGADGDTSAVIAARAKLGGSMKSWKLWLKARGHSDERSLAPSVRKTLKASYESEVKREERRAAKEAGGGTATRTRPPKVKASRKVRRIRANAGDPTEDEDDDKDDDDKDEGGAERTRGVNRIRAQYAEEEDRVDGINRVARQFTEQFAPNEENEDGAQFKIMAGGKTKKVGFAKFKAHAIRTGMDRKEFELQCRRSSYYAGGGEEGRGTAIHRKGGPMDQRCVEIGIMRACGVSQSGVTPGGQKYGWENQYAPEVLEQSDDPRYQLTGSIAELLDLTIRANGQIPIARSGTALFDQAYKVWERNGGTEPRRIEASAFSMLHITNILENVANKTAEASFQSVDGTWRQWVGRRPVNDFKPVSIYVLDIDGNFKKVAQDGELKHITLRDSKRTLQIDTYGCMITIDRKTRINDDMGLVTTKASSLGTLAAVRIEESVYALLLSNAGSFFAVGNGNLISGGGSALGVTSLTTAQLSYQMRTLYGKQIVVSPSILLTGLTLQQRALDLFRIGKPDLGMGNLDTGPVFNTNPHVGRFRPVSTGWLDNTGIRDQDGNALSGQSATQWYLVTNANTPQGSVMEIGFLNGRETPYFDQAETQFNIPGGIQMRSYLDWGVAFGVFQLGLKSAGA